MTSVSQEIASMNWLKKLHEDEEGLTTLEVVMIVAVAAIILALIKVFWGSIKTWFGQSTQNTTQGW
jgi:Flp pilus assembly pilin Flp